MAGRHLRTYTHRNTTHVATGINFYDIHNSVEVYPLLGDSNTPFIAVDFGGLQVDFRNEPQNYPTARNWQTDLINDLIASPVSSVELQIQFYARNPNLNYWESIDRSMSRPTTPLRPTSTDTPLHTITISQNREGGLIRIFESISASLLQTLSSNPNYDEWYLEATTDAEIKRYRATMTGGTVFAWEYRPPANLGYVQDALMADSMGMLPTPPYIDFDAEDGSAQSIGGTSANGSIALAPF